MLIANKRIILILSIMLLLPALLSCQQRPDTTTKAAQTLYEFCIENKGQMINGNPAQCSYGGIMYFNGTDNAINLNLCTVYFDGYNTCSLENGTITSCTKKACYDTSETPRCLDYSETSPSAKNITVRFTCDEGRFEVLFDNAAHVAILNMNGTGIELAQVISGSGAKYSNQNITFFTKGDGAIVYDAKDVANIIFNNCVVS